ncbi:hypothetical protein [Flavobacterium sp.]|uniref:hypothetical protein n=1 Tax=Flavobacterium sp. TaxID=239 RepID=UPI002606EB8F|nr:hypothetical protein [Flavobacterium sp.]
MKKILFLISILQFSLLYSQDEIILKGYYSPQKKYNQIIQQTSETTLEYIGSEELRENLKKKNIQNPTITNQSSTNEAVVFTGKLYNSKNFPLKMKFTKTTNSSETTPILEGTEIYGTGTIGEMPKLDSITSNRMDENSKKSILESLQATFSQLNFPERKIKIGESFSRKSPLSIPISGDTINISMNSSFKLISISNGKANLDVVVIFTMETNSSKFEVTANGQGKGIMIYDIKNNFISKYETDTEMNMYFKTEKFDILMKSKSGYKQKVEIFNN